MAEKARMSILERREYERGPVRGPNATAFGRDNDDRIRCARIAAGRQPLRQPTIELLLGARSAADPLRLAVLWITRKYVIVVPAEIIQGQRGGEEQQQQRRDELQA